MTDKKKQKLSTLQQFNLKTRQEEEKSNRVSVVSKYLAKIIIGIFLIFSVSLLVLGLVFGIKLLIKLICSINYGPLIYKYIHALMVGNFVVIIDTICLGACLTLFLSATCIKDEFWHWLMLCLGLAVLFLGVIIKMLIVLLRIY